MAKKIRKLPLVIGTLDEISPAGPSREENETAHQEAHEAIEKSIIKTATDYWNYLNHPEECSFLMQKSFERMESSGKAEWSSNPAVKQKNRLQYAQIKEVFKNIATPKKLAKRLGFARLRLSEDLKVQMSPSENHIIYIPDYFTFKESEDTQTPNPTFYNALLMLFLPLTGRQLNIKPDISKKELTFTGRLSTKLRMLLLIRQNIVLALCRTC